MGVVDPDAPTISVHAAGGGEAPRVPDATAALVSGEEVGRYTVRRVIDAGGMGVVYEADDRSLGRRVALKVLRSGQTRDPAMAARLVREARTAAGLSHPNVVAVYEVGVHATGPFIAMELVAGTTLRQWLAATPRRWREIVRVFREAGLGIAAAHAAGIVHRDIKPDNILVGDDRVRVADFGLARFAQAPAEPVPATPSGEAAGDRITQVGAVLGTPRYMAPEQREGRDADARADQFSFCTSLDEALTGARDVPVRIRRAIARGMDPDPEARHPSMDALLRELVDEAPRRRSGVLGGVLVVAAAGSALGLGVLRDETAPPCGGAERRLVGIWDEPHKATLAAAFAASSLPYARATWSRAAANLDRYAADWTAAHQQSCEATHVHREQSAELLDRRMACLDDRRRALAILLRAFATPDDRTIETAAAAVGDLPPVDDCSLARLAAAPAPDGSAPARKIDELLTIGRLQEVAGRLGEARSTADRALGLARAADDRAREAAALVLAGHVELLEGDEAKALEHLRRGQELAASTGATSVRVAALIHLGQGLVKVGRLDEAGQIFELAAAALAEAPDPSAESLLLWARGVWHSQRGKYDDARGDLERALALAIEVHGPEAEPLARIYNSLAIVNRRLDRPDEALALARRRLELARQLGDAHPDTAMARNTIGDMLTAAGRYDEAEREFEQAIVALREAYGPRSEKLASVETSFGNMLARRGRWEQAAARFQRALEIKDALGADVSGTLVTRANLGIAYVNTGRAADGERVLREVLATRKRLFGAEHKDVAITQRLVARAVARQGRFAEAAAEFEAALALARKAYGPDHPRVAGVLAWMAEAERARRRFAVARRYDEQAAEIHARQLPESHPERIEGLARLAEDHLGLGAASRARRYAEAALAAAEAHGHGELATDARWVLGRALWAEPVDRPRALELARRARDELAQAEHAAEVAAIDAWLAARDAAR